MESSIDLQKICLLCLMNEVSPTVRFAAFSGSVASPLSLSSSKCDSCTKAPILWLSSMQLYRASEMLGFHALCLFLVAFDGLILKN